MNESKAGCTWPPMEYPTESSDLVLNVYTTVLETLSFSIYFVYCCVFLVGWLFFLCVFCVWAQALESSCPIYPYSKSVSLWSRGRLWEFTFFNDCQGKFNNDFVLGALGELISDVLYSKNVQFCNKCYKRDINLPFWMQRPWLLLRFREKYFQETLTSAWITKDSEGKCWILNPLLRY